MHPPKKGLVYSKHGCLQCKKAHAKCDETKPICDRCRRTFKQCDYQPAFIIKTFDNKLSNSSNVSRPLHSYSKISKLTHIPDKKTKSKSIIKKTNTTNIINNNTNIINNNNINTNNSTTSNIDDSTTSFIPPNPSSFFLQSDINLLNILDLNSDFDKFKINSNSINFNITNNEIIEINNLMKTDGLNSIIKLNPIINLYKENILINNSSNEKNFKFFDSISLNDPIFLKLCWKIFIACILDGPIKLFPINNLISLINHFWNYSLTFPKLNEVIRYLASTVIKSYYRMNEENLLANLWDRYIRMPSLKICNQTVKILLNDLDLTNLVIYTGISLLSYDWSKSINWRIHCNEMLRCLNNINSNLINSLPLSTKILLNFNFLWIHYLELCAFMLSTKGCAIDNDSNLKFLSIKSLMLSKIDDKDNNSKTIITNTNNNNLKNNNNIENIYSFNTLLLKNKFNIITGFVVDYNQIISKLLLANSYCKKNGYPLTGGNILKFKIIKFNPIIENYLIKIGNELLFEINLINKNLNIDHLLNDINDIKLRLSLKNSQKISSITLILYIKFFFLNEDKSNFNNIIFLLENLLENWYSMPLKDSIGTLSHWTLSIGARISILINNDNLLNQFFSLLKLNSQAKPHMVSKGIEQLNYYQNCIKQNDMVNLTNSLYDLPF